FLFSSRRRHTRFSRDWSSDVCSSDLMKAIKHNIALYAIHTNLDNVFGGVNSKIAERLKLHDTAILSPKRALLRKLAVFVPVAHEIGRASCRESVWAR